MPRRSRATVGEPTILHLGMCVVSEYDDDGFIGIQVDAFGENESGMDPFEALHPYGFEGRPLDRADSLEGSQAFYWRDGPEGHVMALGDGRGPQNLPQLSLGSSRQYNSAGAFLLLDTDAETLTAYTPYSGGSKAHVFTMGLDSNGKDYVGLVQALGLALTMLEKSLVLKNAAGDAYIELNDAGITINGNTTVYGGLNAGGGAGLPVMMAVAFSAWWSALTSVISASGTTPLTGATLGAAFAAAGASLTATQSTLLKGV